MMSDFKAVLVAGRSPLFSILIMGCLWVSGCAPKATHDPVYDHFTYEGQDPLYDALDVADDEFVNPIMPGFYPDPSIVRVEDDYYMIHSSFSYFPGIPIFHSKDLVNWTQIGNVLDRPSQMKLDSLRLSRGVFAATIEYHEGTFYVLNTLVDAGGNFLVTATDPAGPWSDPVWLDRVGGIDPSIYFDDDGKVYVINNDAPEGEPLYQGHRAIWIREYDLETNKSISEPKVIINGGVDISQQPVWIEGPHLIKIGDDYYLHAAEGGTGPDHSQVVMKGKSPLGPFSPYEGNPILTQRHISPDREFAVEYTGHADMVETANGEWWTIFLGVRPYDGRNFNIGRETFLLPVTWKDGWPVILEGEKPVPLKLKRPDLPNQPEAEIPTQGNFTITDSFTDAELAPYWLFMRTPYDKWYETGSGALEITARKDHISGLGQPSFIGRRQQHIYASFSTTMSYSPEFPGDEAGLVANQNGIHYFFFGIGTDEEGNAELQLKQQADDELTKLKALHINTTEISLKIEAEAGSYNFYYSENGDSQNWKPFYTGADGTILSTESTGGFVGTVVGMYAYTNAE